MLPAKTQAGTDRMLRVARANAARQHAASIAGYNENPNICTACHKPIPLGSQSVKDVRRKKFCGHSCAAQCTNRARPSRKKMDTVVCSWCGRLFKRWHHIAIATVRNFHNRDCRIQYLRSLRGDKHYSWKGGHSLASKNFYNSVEWHAARARTFKRDNYTCQHCHKRGGKLEAHHIKPRLKFPELALLLINLITLCRKCHKKVHKLAWCKQKHGSLPSSRRGCNLPLPAPIKRAT